MAYLINPGDEAVNGWRLFSNSHVGKLATCLELLEEPTGFDQFSLNGTLEGGKTILENC